MNFLKNTKTALRYWMTVPKDNVAEKLRLYKNDENASYTCGTVAHRLHTEGKLKELAAHLKQLDANDRKLKGETP